MSGLQVLNRDGFQEYFNVNKVLLQMCGILPMKSRSVFVNGLLTSFAIISVVYGSVPAICAAIFRWNKLDKEDRSEIIALAQVQLAVASKVMILLIQRKGLISVLRKCERLWKFVEMEMDWLAVESYALQGRYLTYGFATVIGIVFVTFMSVPLVAIVIHEATNATAPFKRKFPAPLGFYPENDLYYTILYAFEVPAGCMTMVELVGTDTLFFVLISHASAHTRLIQDWLGDDRILNSDGNKLGDTSEWFDVENIARFSKCVAHHQRILKCVGILRFVGSLESLFSTLLFIQISLSVSIICFDGYNLLLEQDDKYKYLLHITAGFMQLFLYCWPSENLITESLAVAEAAYSVSWYRCSSSFRKTVAIMIMRAQKPATVTAAKFTTLSLVTLSSTISTAVSYFTVLKSTI